MELPHHSLNSLFAQLGLPSTDDEIEEFVASHQLEKHCVIEEASFWSEGQKQFLVEEHHDDADWIPWIDELDALLHRDAK